MSDPLTDADVATILTSSAYGINYAADQTIWQLCRDLQAARAKLPEGMKRCTIVFKECPKGHGRLMATNWIDHGCSTCLEDKLRADLAAALAREAALREVCQDAIESLCNRESTFGPEDAVSTLRAALAAKGER